MTGTEDQSGETLSSSGLQHLGPTGWENRHSSAPGLPDLGRGVGAGLQSPAELREEGPGGSGAPGGLRASMSSCRGFALEALTSDQIGHPPDFPAPGIPGRGVCGLSHRPAIAGAMADAGVQLRTPWTQVLKMFMLLLITGCLKCMQLVQAPPSISAEFNLWHTSKYKWDHRSTLHDELLREGLPPRGAWDRHRRELHRS